jgi:hypothetical protein
VALEKLCCDLAAQSATEVDKQRNGAEGEHRQVAGALGRAARREEPIEVPVDELPSLREVALALRRADEGAEIDDRAVALARA